jgi:hypothetical protein
LSAGDWAVNGEQRPKTRSADQAERLDADAGDDPGTRAAQHSRTSRSAEEVFQDHLRLRLENKLEEDLERNYAEDVVLLTVNSNARGHDAIRMSAGRLKEQLPDARFEFVSKQVNGRFALLIWRAISDRFDAMEGADSFAIEDGMIQLQTIHYRLEREVKDE